MEIRFGNELSNVRKPERRTGAALGDVGGDTGGGEGDDSRAALD